METPETMTPERIRALRASSGLTQTEFGRLIGVHWVTVSRWERGRAIPRGIYARLLAAARVAEPYGDGFQLVLLFPGRRRPAAPGLSR